MLYKLLDCNFQCSRDVYTKLVSTKFKTTRLGLDLIDHYSTVYLIFPSSPKKPAIFSYVYFYFYGLLMHIFLQWVLIQIALQSARMLKSIPEELKDDSRNLSYNVDPYLFPRECFGSMSNSSSAIILLSALQNSAPLSPSTYFSKPSRIINSCLPKGRLNIDRCRLTMSARGLILLVSP